LFGSSLRKLLLYKRHNRLWKDEPTPEEREAQLRAFQEAARELECDDDAERFDERVKALARAPKSETPPQS
jgi:hypothetical protein